MEPQARKYHIIVEELGDECIVYDSNNKKAHSLNPTLKWIWSHCDGATTIDELAARFHQEFGAADSLDLVLTGIRQLELANLLEEIPKEAVNPLPPVAPLMSRRAAVAAGSALIPIISSVFVPSAAAQASRPANDPKPGNGNNGKDKDKAKGKLADIIRDIIGALRK